MEAATEILTEQLRSSLRPWTGQDFQIRPLSGGLTNHNFLITAENGERLVLRVAGTDTAVLGIRRADEWICLQQAFALGIGVEPLFLDAAGGVFLMRFVEAAPLDIPETAVNRPLLAKLAGLLRTLHEGPAIPGKFDVFDVIASYQNEATLRGRSFPPPFLETRPLRERLENLIRQDEHRHLVPCHNDLLAGNLLYDRAGGRLWLLDWEYAGMGDARFDLANLFSNLELAAEARNWFLECYTGTRAAIPGLTPGIEAMLVMSDLREAAWGFLQAALRPAADSRETGPAEEGPTDFDYGAYGRQFLSRALSRPLAEAR